MKNKLMNILLILFMGIFVYSGYKVFMWLKCDKETKELEKGLYSEVVSVEADPTDEQEKFLIDFKKLKEINSDVIGWIKINDTYINYPILQGETDEYYLRKDIYKKYNYSGSIFVYSDINKYFLDENTVIYGHNMKNNRMFANICEIYKGALGTDIDVNIYTESTSNIYKIFSCYIEKPNLEIIKNKFYEDEKKNYIDNAVKKSHIDFKQDVNYESNLITLITCGSTSEERVIAHAYEYS